MTISRDGHQCPAQTTFQNSTTMPVTVCFDALGTCFGTDVLVETLEKLMGDRLRAAGSDVRMTIMDWVGWD